jgi:hypothetical protein
VQGSSDFDGVFGYQAAEAYVELDEQGSTWFASARSDFGALEVGVDLAEPLCCVIGASQAVAVADITLSNDNDFAVTPLLRLEIPAGEVILRDRRPLERETIAYFDVLLLDPGTGDVYFHYRLQINTTNGGFERDASSTGNVPIDETLNGGTQWGYKTAPYVEFVLLPILETDEVLQLQYVMEAFGENTPRYVEAEAGFSVKLGDPLTVGGSGSILPVPEPHALVLLGLAALAARGARRRTPRRAAAALLVLLPLLGASEARAQACGSLSEGTPLVLLSDYLETHGNLFPLGAAECEKLTQAAVAACHKVIARLESCAASEIAGSRKMAKTGCGAQGAGEDACLADFDALHDALETGVGSNADSAHAACDLGFATQLALACREGIQ